MTEWLMVILTGVYVIATIIICFFNYKSAKATREQVAESQRQFEETNRPYINATIQIIRGGIVCLIISNTGNKIAKNVKVIINKKFLSLLEETFSDNICKFTSTEIVMGIGQKCIIPLESHHKLEKLSKEDIIIDVSYSDNKKRYNENIIINSKGYQGTLIDANYIKRQTEALELIAKKSKGQTT